MLRNNDYGKHLFFVNWYLIDFVLFNQHIHKIYLCRENQLIITICRFYYY